MARHKVDPKVIAVGVELLRNYKAVVGEEGFARLYKTLGMSRAAASQWFTGVWPISAHHALLIEQASGGIIRAEKLRPDLPWPKRMRI